MTYAEGTTVTVGKSQAEVNRLFERYGVSTYGFGQEPGRAVVYFTLKTLPVRVSIPLPERGRLTERQHEQAIREAWRAVVLLLKANLEAIERKIVTVEQAFLAYIEGADGRVVGEVVIPQILKAHEERLALEAKKK